MSEVSGSRSAGGTWYSYGANNYPTNNTGQPTGMGRVNCIAFDPNNANVIYVGAPSGGIWKTTNANGNSTSWTNLSSNLPSLGVSAIVVHPANSDIIYIGTGDRDANDAPGLGVYKSMDGGVTWNPINNSMGKVTVGSMIMHPSNSNIILAATRGGIYKTTDGGVTWGLKESGNFKEIMFKPGDPSVVYAVSASSISGAKFYRSGNNGDSWTEITAGILDGGTPAAGARMVIAVAPANPAFVYLLQIKESDRTFRALLRSNDSGLSFTTQSTGPNILGYNCDGTGTASQATYDLIITVDPLNANTVYVGSLNNWKSTDGGVSWSIVSHWASTCSGSTMPVHADQHWYEWSPFSGYLYAGNDGGILYSPNGGASWTEITGNLKINQVYKLGQGAGNVNHLVFGLQDNGCTATTNGTDFYTVSGGDGMECAIDYNNSNYCYDTYHSGLMRRSTTGPIGNYSYIAGEGYNGIDESGGWVAPYLLHKTIPSTMFGGYKNVWRSTNVRASSNSAIVWEKISTGETLNCIDIDQSAADLNILYAVRSGSIKRTDNANDVAANVTWTSCNLPNGLTPTAIETHPTDANIVYVTAGYYVFKSSDKGMSWTEITGNLPALFNNCLVIDKNANEGLYVGNQTGVWYKNATMTDWILFSNGLALVDVRELEIYYDAVTPANNRIKAATYGRGIWESDLAEINVINPANFVSTAISNSQINLSWTKNAANDDVIVVTSPSIIFGNPTDGNSYFIGNTLPNGGGTVIYTGNAASFSHTSLNAGETYYYKIWSVNGSSQYSAGSHYISETTDCITISTLPYTESFENPSCWRAKDYTSEGNWQFGTTSNVNYTPALTGSYAYFKSDYGVAHTYNADLISPPFDLSAYPNVLLQYKHLFDASSYYPSTGAVYYSIDNGTTWVSLASYSSDSPNPQEVSLSVNAAAGQSQVKFKWSYTCSPTGAYLWAVDDIQVSDNSNYWTGTVDSDWFKAGNWGKGTIPTSTDAVVIPSTAPNQPQINAAGAVCNNLTINAGASLTMNASTAYTLSVAGDWTNNGTFTRGIGTVDFNGTNDLQLIKGSSTTAFNILKVTKGSQNRILEATSLISLNAATNPLVLTSGTFKLSSASTIAPFTSDPSIGSNSGLWNNGGTVNSGNFNITINAGLLRVSAGTINIGTNSNNYLLYLNNGKLTIEGGAINIASRIKPNSGTSTGTYLQTGGILTLNTVGSTSTTDALFQMNSGCTFTMSSGTIVIQKASSNTTADYINLATANNITGGTLQIGNASTPASQTIRINSTVPIFNLVVNASNSPTAQLLTNSLTVKNDVTIAGGTLNANNLNLNVGGNWTNTGTFTPGTGTVTLNGTLAQSIAGNNSTTFKGLTMNNSSGVTLSGSVNASVDGVLTLTSGVISTGANKLIITSNGSVSRTSGHVFGNLQKNIRAGSSITRTFELGDASSTNYTPVSLTFASVTTSGDLVAATTSGDHPNISAATLNANKSVNRYWSLSNSGTVFTTYDALFNFLTGDVDASASTSNLICGKYSGSTWTYPGVGIKTANSTQITSETSFSDFQLAESGPIAKVSIVAGGNWSNPDTWNPSGVPVETDDVSITATGTVIVDITDAACNNIAILSGASLLINQGKALSVNGTLTNNAGTNGLVIKSDATGTGSLIHSNSGVSATVERYIAAADWITWDDGWHLLSSPIANHTIAGSFTVVPENEYDFYAWSEPDNLWINFKETGSPNFADINGSNTFKSGAGYLVAYKDADTKLFTGNLNVSDVNPGTLTLSSGVNQGWNLLGNPFASALTWYTGWTVNNIGGVANIWNEVGKSYTPRSAGDPIPQANGFMVQVLSGTGSLTIPASARVHNAQGWYKNMNYPVVSLFAHNTDNPSFQESQVRFNPEATEGFDNDSDGNYLPGYAPQFYSTYSGHNLMVNSLPYNDNLMIPFDFVKNEGDNFRIEAAVSGDLSADIYLLDKQTGTDHNLSQNPVYSFIANSNDNHDRFMLHFKTVGISEPANSDQIAVVYVNGTINITNMGQGKIKSVSVTDMAGHSIYKGNQQWSNTAKISVSASLGVYLIFVETETQFFVKKLLIY